ncbi:MAG: thermonuclease family protein [Desulfobacteraceae bacterium]|nr:MAG: thermonuclease family protein [Desulfobacteraceae bacterium]
MKLNELVLLITLACLCLSMAPSEYRSVDFVYDGDTILLDGGDKVRYLGIDAPEIDHKGGKSEFMARAARNFNVKLVKDSRVKLEYDQEKRDRYGRRLAYVFLENGDMVNAVLLRKGLAHVMLHSLNVKYKTLLLDCQRKAMKEMLGIWRRSPKKEEKYYLGNKSSYRFHRPGCHFGRKISRRNVVRFQSRYNAFWAGFSPCKRCRP